MICHGRIVEGEEGKPLCHTVLNRISSPPLAESRPHMRLPPSAQSRRVRIGRNPARTLAYLRLRECARSGIGGMAGTGEAGRPEGRGALFRVMTSARWVCASELSVRESALAVVCIESRSSPQRNSRRH
jgi:hypothetical protein